jgi:beta-lactamase regulating signal transducer with metallopeptidase domain
VEPFELLSSRVAAELAVAVLVKGTVVLGLAWLATLLLRRQPSAERHAVWTVAFVVALLVPLAGRLVPTRTVPVLHYPRELISTTLAVPEIAPLATPEAPVRAETAEGGGASGEPSAATAPPDETATHPGAVLSTPGNWWIRSQAPLAVGFLVVWLFGALVFAVRLGSHWVRVGLLTLRGRTAGEDRVVRLVRAEARRQGIRRPLRVVYSDALPVPATWGTLRPNLILPSEAPEWAEDKLRAVMVHELAHVRRWDFLSQQISELARVVYWVNPLLWLAVGQAAGERERACDDEVLSSGLRSFEYARLLVEMARRYTGLVPGTRPGLDGGLALARPCTLRQRIHEILEKEKPRGRGRAGVALAASLALGLVAVPVTSVSLLSATPGTGTVPELIQALDHPDAAVRMKAIRSLGRECAPEAVAALARVLREETRPELRLTAAFVLGETESFMALKPLQAALTDPDPRVAHMALKVMGHIDHRWSARAVLPYLESSDAGVRWLALRSLGMMRLQFGWLRPRLARSLEHDPSPVNRAMAAAIMGRNGCPEDVTAALESARHDESPLVRAEAERVLATFGGGPVPSGA